MELGISAVAYIRVSTEKQDYERQRDEVNAYAKNNGFVILQTFEDKQSGSTYDDRQGLQDLLEYLRENTHIKVLIIDEVSRLGREQGAQAHTYNALVRQGVQVHTRGQGKFEHTPDGKFIFGMHSIIAEYEKARIIDRTSSGRRKVVRDGNTQISVRPYGYNLILTQKKDRQVLKRQFVEVNEQEAGHVRAMFDIVAKGGSVFAVLRYLKENHVKPPKEKTKEWGKSSVLRILHNTTYVGQWQFGKWAKNYRTKYSLTRRPNEETDFVKVPHIISQDLFDRAQASLGKNRVKYNPGNAKATFVFQGLITCACGRIMNSIIDARSKQRYYRCPQRNIEGVSKKECPIQAVKADFMESILLSQLKTKMSKPGFMWDVKEKKLKGFLSLDKNLEKRQHEIEKEIKNHERDLKKNVALSVEEQNQEIARAHRELAQELSKEIGEKRSELERIGRQLAEDQKKSIDYAFFQEIQKDLDALPLGENGKVPDDFPDDELEEIDAKILQYMNEKELREFESSLEKKTEFVRTYISSINLSFQEKETEKIREKVKALRGRSFHHTDNKNRRDLYFSVFNRDGEVRQSSTQVLGLDVHFVNNYNQALQLLYFHENPRIFKLYLREGIVQKA